MSTLVAADVKALYPEFTEAGDPLIVAKLAAAETRLDRTIFIDEDTADAAVLALTAHLLATSPSGINLKFSSKDGSSIYWPDYERMIHAAAIASRPIP